MNKALTIAGSDSGGGAGIQADLKTFSALGVYGTSVVTALTAQNTTGVFGVHPVPPDFVVAQLDAVMTDIGTDAAKTGMLGSVELIEVVAAAVARHAIDKLVVDPVMVAKSGDRLLAEDSSKAIVKYLLPRALVVTPNLPEAEVLSGRRLLPDDAPRGPDAWKETGKVDVDIDVLKQAARVIADLGPRFVIVKGGHLPGRAVDVVFDGADFTELDAERVQTGNTHGTGCTFSAAIAAGLARGLEPLTAMAEAKTYLTEALRASVSIGAGHSPVHHFHRWWKA